jgi:phenylacetate-CoA ligase
VSVVSVDLFKRSAITDEFFRRVPFFYNQVFNFFQKMELCDQDGRKQLQRQRAAEILRAARKAPHYRSMGLSQRIEDWPPLAKEDLRDHPEAFAATSIVVSPAATGGTTGIPLTLRRSWRAVVAEQVAVDRFIQIAGIQLAKARIAVLRGDTIKESWDTAPPFGVMRAGGRRMILSSNHLSSRTVGEYVRQLHEFKPDLITVYPSSLEALCGFIEPAGVLIPNLKLVFSSSEVLRPDVRQRAAIALNATVFDQYGQAERVSLALSTKPEEFFFQPAYGLAELQFAYSDEAHDYYHIQGTSLWNTAQFLVRYQTGDLAILAKGTTEADVEKISLGLKPFLGIAGRSSEYIETPTGEHVVGINQIPRGLSGVVQMQFVQRATHRVDIYVVPQHGLSESLREQIIRQARSKIPHSVDIKLHQVDRIERTKSGKAPLLIREINS